MPLFSPSEAATLARLCEALVPVDHHAPGGLTAGAADTDLAHWLAIGLERAATPAQHTQFKTVLRLFENPAFNAATVGIAKPLARMDQAERERLLRAWALSPLPTARGFFQSIKRLGLFLHYSLDVTAPNPAYAAIGYGGQPAPVPDPPPRPPMRPIQPLTITGETALTCDTLIIGSGAGGGVIAERLTAAGHDVLIVEKGPYYHAADFHGRELESTEKLFEKYGTLTTADLGLTVLAGSVLGGGTTVNWAASLRTPDEVRHEWAHEYGFAGAESAAFTASLDRISAELNINTHAADNAQNCALHDGCAALGYAIQPIPRNTDQCADADGVPRCGFCNYGCAYDSKRGTLKVHLAIAHQRGARVLVGAVCQRVRIERGQVTGADLTVNGADGTRHAVRVTARRVIVCAGAIHTPALLRRSGLSRPAIGDNLRLHPATVTYGLFDQPIRGWQGAPLTQVSSQFANLDGAGYGVRLETAPVHPGIAGLVIPWLSARQHRSVMAALPHLAVVLVITRDRFGGRVGVDKHGQPVLHYRLHAHDAAHVRRGIVEGLKIHHAAGAHTLSSPHARELVYTAQPAADGRGRWPGFTPFLEAVAAAPLGVHQVALFSAHQMGSCRIGPDADHGAVDPSGAVYGVRGLYVADASVMPTPCGVNPMLTIMALADYLSAGWG